MKLASDRSRLGPDNVFAGHGQGAAKRLGEAASVFSEVMATPDKGIPHDLLDKAHCIVIVPSLKAAAFIFGGKYGKGYLSCRNKSGARNSVSDSARRGCGTLCRRDFSEAEKSLSQAEAYQERKAGRKPVTMAAREAVQMAEDSRAIAVKRQEEEALTAERQQSAEREAHR